MPYTSLKLTNKILIIKIPLLNFSGEIKCGVGLSLVEVRFLITEDRRTGSDKLWVMVETRQNFVLVFFFQSQICLVFKLLSTVFPLF